jgi:hypothetical protein
MIDAYHPQAMSQPYSSSNTLNPQQWNPSVQRYREPNDHMLGHAGGDHSPSPHVISPELSPHLHHSDYSPSPPGQDRLQPVNGSGPGPDDLGEYAAKAATRTADTEHGNATLRE